MKRRNYMSWVYPALLSVALSACGGGDSESNDLADAYAYKENTTYSTTIKECIMAQESAEYCSLDELPFIGMEYNDPGIAQILDRVVVSHEWMGERFEEILYEMPQEILPLFKAVTAIVIDDDTRPAFFSSGTGAIYLDPAYLWLSVDEKRTINPKEDFRSGFDAPLAFRQLQRYLKDGEPVYRHASLHDDSTRELSDVFHLAARLLFHELAHANDFLPPNSYDEINPSLTPAQTANTFRDRWISTMLSDTSPLLSETMHSLADVIYLGTTPSLGNLEISALDVGMAFEPDGASDDYGYSSQFEDLAMLFENVMMKHLFDADYELAFTNVPEDASACEDYFIGWGMRNRIGNSSVRQRAQLAAEELLPGEDFSAFFDELDSGTEISGDWCISTSESQKAQEIDIDPTDSLRPYL